MTKLSIIVPVYNVELYLSRCLESIIAQIYSDWECILIDDGSLDSSGAICDEYAKEKISEKYNCIQFLPLLQIEKDINETTSYYIPHII